MLKTMMITLNEHGQIGIYILILVGEKHELNSHIEINWIDEC